MRAAEKKSTEECPVKMKLVAPPLYVLTTNVSHTLTLCVKMASPCLTKPRAGVPHQAACGFGTALPVVSYAEKALTSCISN